MGADFGGLPNWVWIILIVSVVLAVIVGGGGYYKYKQWEPASV